MIVRTVLAVALGAALLAVSVPAIDSAARERTEAAVAADVDRFVDRVRSLVDTDDAVRSPGARRIVTLDLPKAGWTSAPLEDLSIEPSLAGDPQTNGPNASAISWALEGGDRHRRILEELHLRTPGSKPLVLEEPGHHRLVLSLRGSNVEPAVRVERYQETVDDW